MGRNTLGLDKFVFKRIDGAQHTEQVGCITQYPDDKEHHAEAVGTLRLEIGD